MEGSPSAGHSTLFTPFRLIVLGATLLLATALTSATIGMAFALSFSPAGLPSPGFFVAEEVIFAVAGVLGPLGSFLLLIGLARALRPWPSAGTPPKAVPSPESLPGKPRFTRRPYRVTALGALVVLVAGIAQFVFSLTLLLMSPNLVGTDFAAYERLTGSIRFAITILSAVGGFVAFYGLALALRDGWLRSPDLAR